MSIRSLPLDAWAVIFRHLPPEELVASFDRLFVINAFGTDAHRLDIFWAIMSRLDSAAPAAEPEVFCDFPDAAVYRSCHETLVEMGFHTEYASSLTSTARGSLDLALHILGWDT